MITNYHTHTKWCHHATGETEEYIKEAIARGLEVLAITDHVPLMGDPDPRRLAFDEFDAFNRELDALVHKYQEQITVLKGFECEYCPEELENYRRYRDEYGYQILILGQHTSCSREVDNFFVTEPWQVELYAREVQEALETGLFTFLAHPDLPMCRYRRFDETFQQAMHRIFATCERVDVPLEINANGLHYNRGYPCPEVWQTIAPEYRVRCLVGSDAHAVEDLADPAVRACEELARKAGLSLLTHL